MIAPPAPRDGFTLVECAIVCAVAAVLVAVALPTWRGEALRAARLDGVQALTRLQVAQEQHRSTFGVYAEQLRSLQGIAAVSAQGRYTLTVTASGPEAYRASAAARGVQTQDSRCAVLTLDVTQGFAQPGPNPECWNR